MTASRVFFIIVDFHDFLFLKWFLFSNVVFVISPVHNGTSVQ